ncbi:MAG: histidine phosphatase family protein [Lachnospiraceae bacterium]|nr:histidine phosphatase family protein [Lachnospiraceae bacterium]
MRILLIRHGDPDYVHDTLTEKGRREAALLAEHAGHLNLGDCYVSPLGRAQATASYSLEKLRKTATTLDWLQEFPARVDINRSEILKQAYPDTRKEGDRFVLRNVWDMVPSFWANQPDYQDREGWRRCETARHSDLTEVYDYVTRSFDRLLEQYGYVRDGMCYRVEREDTRTVTFFCHFGISCVLLSHLWNMAPFPLLHNLGMAPTSVTEVVSEEREQGTAYFRALRIGDTTHLYAGGEPTSFACRFCETYSNWDQRH